MPNASHTVETHRGSRAHGHGPRSINSSSSQGQPNQGYHAAPDSRPTHSSASNEQHRTRRRLRRWAERARTSSGASLKTSEDAAMAERPADTKAGPATHSLHHPRALNTLRCAQRRGGTARRGSTPGPVECTTARGEPASPRPKRGNADRSLALRLSQPSPL